MYELHATYEIYSRVLCLQVCVSHMSMIRFFISRSFLVEAVNRERQI
jgi:hypothetical protein